MDLIDQFDNADIDRWQARAKDVLTRARADWAQHMGVESDVAPLYPGSTRAPAIVARAPMCRWKTIQRLDLASREANLQQFSDDIAGGTDMFELVCADSHHGFGAGFSVDILGGLADDLLERCAPNWQDPEGCGPTIMMSTGAEDDRVIAAFLERLHAKKLMPTTNEMAPGKAAQFRIDFGLDPLTRSVWNGGAFSEPGQNRLKGTVARIIESGLTGPIFCADGRLVHAAGGSPVQELTFVLSSAIYYLRFLAACDVKDPHTRLRFYMASDTRQFVTIAKFRALRRLWARLSEACGWPITAVPVYAQTAWPMMSAEDPFTNIIRTTMAAAGAGVGGADAITILPFTQARCLPNALARRIARNVSAVLREESGLYRVADPGHGAGFIEQLTDELARHSWTEMQRIEAGDGLANSLTLGKWQEEVARFRDQQVMNLVEKKKLILGVNAFRSAQTQDVTPVSDEAAAFMDDADPAVMGWPNAQSHPADAVARLVPLRWERAYASAITSDAPASGANASGANASGANASGANASGATGADISGSSQQSADLAS